MPTDAKAEAVQEMPGKRNDETSMVEASNSGFEFTEGTARGFKDAGNIGCPGDKFVNRELDDKEMRVEDPSKDSLDFGWSPFSNQFGGLH